MSTNAVEAPDFDPAPAPDPEPDARNRQNQKNLELIRHQRKCSICNHPEREAIEQEFIDWGNVGGLAHRYKLPHRSTVYAHAHATGLFPRRSANMRRSLEQIIEQAGNARITADGVIRAIRAYSCLTDDGKWVEPASHVIVSSGSARPAPTALATLLVTGASADANRFASGAPGSDRNLPIEVLEANSNLYTED